MRFLCVSVWTPAFVHLVDALNTRAFARAFCRVAVLLIGQGKDHRACSNFHRTVNRQVKLFVALFRFWFNQGKRLCLTCKNYLRPAQVTS
jgi:hypothetical protein